MTRPERQLPGRFLRAGPGIAFLHTATQTAYDRFPGIGAILGARLYQSGKHGAFLELTFCHQCLGFRNGENNG